MDPSLHHHHDRDGDDRGGGWFGSGSAPSPGGFGGGAATPPPPVQIHRDTWLNGGQHDGGHDGGHQNHNQHHHPPMEEESLFSPTVAALRNNPRALRHSIFSPVGPSSLQRPAAPNCGKKPPPTPSQTMMRLGGGLVGGCSSSNKENVSPALLRMRSAAATDSDGNQHRQRQQRHHQKTPAKPAAGQHFTAASAAAGLSSGGTSPPSAWLLLQSAKERRDGGTGGSPPVAATTTPFHQNRGGLAPKTPATVYHTPAQTATPFSALVDGDTPSGADGDRGVMSSNTTNSSGIGSSFVSPLPSYDADRRRRRIVAAEGGDAAGLGVGGHENNGNNNDDENIMSTPYGGLPRLDMVTLEYIGKCDDPTTLGQIVGVLGSHRDEYPFLFRHASDRLRELTTAAATSAAGTSADQQQPPPPGIDGGSSNDIVDAAAVQEEETTPVVTPANHHRQQRKPFPRKATPYALRDSLELSLSDDDCEVGGGGDRHHRHRISNNDYDDDGIHSNNDDSGEVNVSASSSEGPVVPLIAGGFRSSRLGGIGTPDIFRRRRNHHHQHQPAPSDAAAAGCREGGRSLSILPPPILPAPEMDENVNSSRPDGGGSNDRRSLLFSSEKLEIQQHRKQQAEKELLAQQQKQQQEEQANELAAAREWKSALERMEQQLEKVRLALDEEQESGRRSREEANETERKLSGRIRELTAELEGAGHWRRKHEDLRELLQSSQQNLRNVQEERDEILKSLVQVSFDDKPAVGEIKKLSKEEREKLLGDLMKQAVASKSAMQALAETVKSAEIDRNKAVQSYRTMKRQLKLAKETNDMLESDRADLINQISQLTDEVAAWKANTDQALESARMEQQHEWGTREQGYKNTIQSLQTQLKKMETSMIPLSKYMTVLETSQDALNHKQELEKELDSLRGKVSYLQAELDAQLQKKFPAPSREPFVKSAAQPYPAPAAAKPTKPSCPPPPPQPPAASTATSTPPNTNNVNKAASSTNSTGVAVDRFSAVRRAGGRKALEEQLRRARSGSPRPRPRPLQNHN